jgi:ABC-2 type transport system permease protein
MKDIGLLTTAGIRNNLKLKTVGIVFIIITLMLTALVVILFCILLIEPAVNKASPDRAELELYLNLVTYTTCFLALGINLNSYGFQSMTREKTRGNIESLLATPIKIKDIWIAKALAIFIPGLVVGEIFTLITLIAVNYVYFVPSVGFIINPWIAVNSFIAAPLVYLCLGLLAYLIGLTGKPATGNIIAQIFLPVVINIVAQLMIRTDILTFTSWSFMAVNVGLALVIIIITFFLQSRLKKERIILSC